MRALTFGSIAARSFARTVPTTSSCAARAACSTTTARTAKLGRDSPADGASCLRQPLLKAAAKSVTERTIRNADRWPVRVIKRSRDRSSGFWAVARATATARADAKFHENALKRTEAGEGGLEKVEPDERREEKPAWVDPMSEREAGEHKRAGDKIDDVLDFQNVGVSDSARPLLIILTCARFTFCAGIAGSSPFVAIRPQRDVPITPPHRS